MFHPMKPETIERRARERKLREAAARASFEANVLAAQARYDWFVFPDVLPEENILHLEAGEPGTRGYRDALYISASRIRFEIAF